MRILDVFVGTDCSIRARGTDLPRRPQRRTWTNAISRGQRLSRRYEGIGHRRSLGAALRKAPHVVAQRIAPGGSRW